MLTIHVAITLYQSRTILALVNQEPTPASNNLPIPYVINAFALLPVPIMLSAHFSAQHHSPQTLQNHILSTRPRITPLESHSCAKTPRGGSTNTNH